MRVVLACSEIKSGDAIGHDLACQCQSLKEEGIDAHIYTELFEPDTAGLVNRDALRFLDDRETILIYHHGVYWGKGMDIYKSARCRKVLKYHNITPAHYFSSHSPHIFNICALGRWQNSLLMDAGIDMLMADSNYNASEFIEMGFPDERTRVLPPFTAIHDFDSTEEAPAVKAKLSGDRLNVFFVGRISPNKGIGHILYTAHYYKMLFDDNVRFSVVGHVSPHLVSYYKDLIRMAGRLEVSEIVEFTGRLTQSELVTYYRNSHMLLHLSEHEGFCVPILEAQHAGLPILAYSPETSAVSETIGPDQVVFKDLDYETMAAAINVTGTDKEVREFLVEKGQENYIKYEKSEIKGKLVNFLNELA